MKNLIVLSAFLLFLGAILFPISAFASSNSDAQISGEGAEQISGVAVSSISYQLANDSAIARGVTFDLDSPAGQVSAKVSSATMEFAPCTNIGGYRWQCTFQAGIAVASMDEFRVIAVGD